MNPDRYRDVEQRLWTSLGLDPTEREVHLDRLGTRARLLELGEGPPVLFIHGATASGANWAPSAAHLDGFRCLLLDRPGYGLSAPLDVDLSDLELWPATGHAPWMEHPERAAALVADFLGRVRLGPR